MIWRKKILTFHKFLVRNYSILKSLTHLWTVVTLPCTASAAGQDRCQDQASTSNSKQYFANNPPPIQPASVHPSGNNRSHSSLEQASSDDEFRRKTNVHPTRIPFPYSLSTCRVISEFTTTTTSFHSDFR